MREDMIEELIAEGRSDKTIEEFASTVGSKEMWVELGMQLAKSGAPTAGGDKPEPTIANLTTPFYTQIYKFSNLPIIPYSHSPFLSNYLDKPCLYQRFSDLHHTHPGIILWRRHFIQLHTFIFSTQ